MKIDQSKILLDTFIAFNKDRYVDDAEKLALFETVTPAQLAIEVNNPSGAGSEVTVTGPGFVAPETTYVKADIGQTVNGWTLANTAGPITSGADLIALTTAGVYEVNYLGETKVALLLEGMTDRIEIQTAANALIADSHLYDLGEGVYETDGEYMFWEEAGDDISLKGQVPVFFMEGGVVELSGEFMGTLEIPGEIG